MPDINTLPPSPNQPPTSNLHLRSMASSQDFSGSPPQSYSPLSSHSLAAAAALNAGLHNESRRSSNGSLSGPRAAHRRSSIRMSLNLNDVSVPGPGELQSSPGASRRVLSWPESPSHQRAPSLGELHQELENEQEMQVNRLLSMIRQQQQQILSLQTANAAPGSSAVAIDDSTPTSERSMSLSHPASLPPQNPSHPSPGSAAPGPRSPFISHSLSRHSSYRSSRDASPSIPANSGHHGPHNDNHELLLGASASRDESAFYQAETQTLTRENQMLKMRIRELERQLNPMASTTHSPATASNLMLAPINSDNGEASSTSTAEHSPEVTRD